MNNLKDSTKSMVVVDSVMDSKMCDNNSIILIFINVCTVHLS